MANNNKKTTENGSSLIAMAILTIIIGTMINGFLFIYQNQEKLNKDQETTDKNKVILAAINNYVMHNGRLPCPAPLNAPRDTAFFGQEDPNFSCDNINYYNNAALTLNNSIAARGVLSVAPLPACPAGAPNCRPVPPTAPPPPGNVKIGALPTRNLKLPDKYMVDGYGKRYVYAVTERLATQGFNNNANLGAIDITDSSGNSLPKQRGYVKYIFFSPGVDDRGAYSVEGSLIRPCDLTVLAGENCDFQSANPANRDATFISSFFKQYN